MPTLEVVPDLPTITIDADKLRAYNKEHSFQDAYEAVGELGWIMSEWLHGARECGALIEPLIDPEMAHMHGLPMTVNNELRYFAALLQFCQLGDDVENGHLRINVLTGSTALWPIQCFAYQSDKVWNYYEEDEDGGGVVAYMGHCVSLANGLIEFMQQSARKQDTILEGSVT